MTSERPQTQIYVGDALTRLRELPGKSVACCVTSPPYLGLRDYQTGVWVGGDPTCDHVKEWRKVPPSSGGFQNARSKGIAEDTQSFATSSKFQFADLCQKCGARREDQQIGLEGSVGAYVSRLVEVFMEVFRVLRDDGVFFLVIGDSYARDPKKGGSGPNGKQNYIEDYGAARKRIAGASTGSGDRLPAKNLMGVPWRVAFTLQDAGWILRSDCLWTKKNALPESVTDRPTKAHEYVFMFVKQSAYYYDKEAAKEPCASNHPSGNGFKRAERLSYRDQNGPRGNDEQWQPTPSGRNTRTYWDFPEERLILRKDLSRKEQDFVLGKTPCRQIEILRQLVFRVDQIPEKLWHYFEFITMEDLDLTVFEINAKPFAGAHFATFPSKLVERCLLASTSEHGVCAHCGAPYRRLVQKGELNQEWQAACGANSSGSYNGYATKDFQSQKAQNASDVKRRILEGMREKKTVGWEATCSCECPEVIPATVLDCFSGAGTTMLVANKLGRNAIGIELSPEYAQMAKQRIEPYGEVEVFSDPGGDDPTVHTDGLPIGREVLLSEAGP